MRGLTRRWILTEGGAGEAGLLERLLAARGVTDRPSIDRFCEPSLHHLHDPVRLPGLEAAAERLVAAVRTGQRIVIYGDYDVDGITATAILYHVIRCAQPDADVRSYVPHRLDEGYGINCDALRQLRSDGANLVISVDCGITAHESAATARSLGLDLIITDHHRPAEGREDLPDACAVVHPGLPGSDYPFADLCGAGVAFKLAWRFASMWCGSERVSQAFKETLMHMLPLAALGTIADVVPLVDENRVLAQFGLRLIKQTPLVGLRSLIEASNLMDDSIDCEKVGFVLGPRLNACGRMGHAAEAVEMLTCATADRATTIAQNLNRLNRQRQQTEKRIFEQAAEMAESAGMTGEDRRIIILAREDWHPGVVGIVCSRLIERFGRPAILMQRQADTCKGSARSIDDYSIHAALSAVASHLRRFGGHDMAAGVELEASQLEAFVDAMTAHANRHINADQLMPAVHVDCDARIDEMDLDCVGRIGALAPFGRANPRPTVRLREAVVAEVPKQIGGAGKHLSLRLRQDGPGGRRLIRAVWWRRGGLAAELAPGMCVEALIEPKLNHWQGRTSVEAELRDVRICEPGEAVT